MKFKTFFFIYQWKITAVLCSTSLHVVNGIKKQCNLFTVELVKLKSKGSTLKKLFYPKTISQIKNQHNITSNTK